MPKVLIEAEDNYVFSLMVNSTSNNVTVYYKGR
jgi:hypothetical protein